MRSPACRRYDIVRLLLLLLRVTVTVVELGAHILLDSEPDPELQVPAIRERDLSIAGMYKQSRQHLITRTAAPAARSAQRTPVRAAPPPSRAAHASPWTNEPAFFTTKTV